MRRNYKSFLREAPVDEEHVVLLHGESNRESGLHCFLRLERALCWRSGRCLAGVAFSV